MPAQSEAQRRLILAAADRGEKWAQEWVERYGHGLGLEKKKQKA